MKKTFTKKKGELEHLLTSEQKTLYITQKYNIELEIIVVVRTLFCRESDAMASFC